MSAAAGKRIKTRYRISMLAGGSVLLAFLLMLLIFNIGIRRQMDERAKEAIEEALENNYGFSSEAMYYAEMFSFPESISEKNKESWYTRNERNLIDWCLSHETEDGIVQQIRDEGKTYYLSITREEVTEEALWREDFRLEGLAGEGAGNTWLEEEGTYITVAYVDVTGEPEMLARISLYILFAALAVGLVGSLIGYLTGRKLEMNEESQKRFFENTSHELKTPLAAIRGYAEGIETGVITDTKKTGRVIASQADKMSSLIEEILLMAKLEGGALPLQKTDVDIPGLIQDCLMPLEGIVTGRHLSVDLDLGEGTVQADPDQLEHAFSNLIFNAVKYAETRIRIVYSGNVLRIWNDCGEISEEDRRHFFDRFYTGKNGSTGIGLALAKDIIQLHGFSIEARREENGIAFIVKL